MPFLGAIVPAVVAVGASAAGTAAAATGATVAGLSAAAWGGIAAGAGVIGSVVSSMQSNNANADAAKVESKQAQINADLQAQQYDQNARRERSRAEAMIGASGVSSTSGSPLELLIHSAYNAELNKENIKRGGQIESNSLNRQASLYRGRNAGELVGGLGRVGGGIVSSFLK